MHGVTMVYTQQPAEHNQMLSMIHLHTYCTLDVAVLSVRSESLAVVMLALLV